MEFTVEFLTDCPPYRSFSTSSGRVILTISRQYWQGWQSCATASITALSKPLGDLFELRLARAPDRRGAWHSQQGLGHPGSRPEDGRGAPERLANKVRSVRKTNFDSYLEEQLKDTGFSERFKKAGVAWDLAVQLAALRQQAGLSQKDLARKLRTSQQQISRLESPSYEGHSLSMLRRVADALGATVQVSLVPGEPARRGGVAEAKGIYRTRKKA